MSRFFVTLMCGCIGLVAGFTVANVAAQKEEAPASEEQETEKSDEVKNKEEALKRKVVKFIEASGTKKLMDEMLIQMSESLKGVPGLPPGFFDEFLKRAKTDDLIELTVPVYIKYYNEKTIDAAIAYYESEEGKKFSAKMPEVQSECYKIGEEWGRKLGEEVARDLMPKDDLKEQR